MTDDIVTRLRMPVCGNYDDDNFLAGPQPCRSCCEAADEIERLRKLGDALADTGGQHGFDKALDAWKEMRGER